MTRHYSGARSRRRATLLAVGILGSLAALCAFSAAQEQLASHSKRPETAGEKFKNIQVLKRLPADQLLPTMHTWSASLGVRCDFCHVVKPDHTGWELDDKPAKRMARKMVLLVENLNAHQRILDNKATCFMCHHGHAMPENQAPAEAPPGR